jgi:hypothetical protein
MKDPQDRVEELKQKIKLASSVLSDGYIRFTREDYRAKSVLIRLVYSPIGRPQVALEYELLYDSNWDETPKMFIINLIEFQLKAIFAEK